MIYDSRNVIRQAKNEMIPYIQKLEASRRLNDEVLSTIPVFHFTTDGEVTTLVTYTKEEQHAIEKLYETALHFFIKHPQTTLAFYQWIYNTYKQPPSSNILQETARMFTGYDDDNFDLIRWLDHTFWEARSVWGASHQRALF